MSDAGTISVLIVEDELQSRNLLADYIASRPELLLRDIARNGKEALEKLRSHPYDLLFLDINLPLLSGLEVLEQLDSIPYIIFTTVSRSHALQAFEVGALDYLHKPISREKFNRTIDRVLPLIHNERSSHNVRPAGGLVVTEQDNHFLIPYNDIIYISSHGKQSVIHTAEREVVAARLLLDLEQRIPAARFMRIHKQYIVNLEYISHIQYMLGGRYQAFLKDSEATSLTVSRKQAPELKKRLNISND